MQLAIAATNWHYPSPLSGSGILKVCRRYVMERKGACEDRTTR
jgi:hypothetical protein